MMRTDSQHPAWLQEAEKTLIRYCENFSDVLITQASGACLYTKEGDRILDFTSGQMCAIFGHSHPRIVEALHRGTRSTIHLLSAMLSPAVIELSRRLSELLPESLSRSMFLSTGGESNEMAIRMAKLATGGFEVIGFTGSWHGMTAGAQSHTYSLTRRSYGPVMPGSYAIPAPNSYRCPIRHCEGQCDNTCLDVGMELVDQQSVGAYAALIVEPVLSAAGIIELPPDYLKRLKAHCESRGLLLIFDEAQTGIGRLGDNFGFEQSGVVPDFLTLSKTLGGGLPLSATVTSAALEEACYEKGFISVTSHVSDPLPAEAGLTVLSILVEEKMQERARKMGAYLKAKLLELQKQYECIGDVRGRGLLLGMEIVKDRISRAPDPELGSKIAGRCLRNGLSMNIVRIKGYGGVFRIAPPLTITKAELDEGVEILERSIRESLEG
ncbi:MAG: aspartate aminotransferase family protein [Phaeodactylibacter sp.]|uniref:aspartate aminotransferase family protein n=1 Tax=Phaeodactylibacter sp. TaxID=1940289 RepID=UPI0032EC0ABE